METNQRFHIQVPKNLFVNILSFISSILIGLWLTPYLISHLGIVAYGLIPLAMFFSQYVSVIINSINMSISRFLLIALHKNDAEEANKIFSTSMGIIAIFISLQALIMLFVLLNITTIFTIPESLLIDATWLFGLTFAGFSISLIRSIYGTSLFAYNRLDILRSIDIVQNLARVIIIVIFFIFDEPSLMYVGLANLLSSLLVFFPTFMLFKKYTPFLKINFNAYDRLKVRELSKMSYWILINQVGVLLIGNIDLYLVNSLIGSKETGEYAIIVQVINLFRTLAALLVGVVAPITMIYYANKEHEKLKKVLTITSKLMSIFITIPLAIAIYFSGNLLEVWLGKEFVYLNNILSFSLLFLLFSVPIMPLFQINVAYNKVKIPALLTIIFGILNVVGIYLLIRYTHLGLWGVVIAKIIYEVLYNVFFMPLYSSHVLGIKKSYFFQIPLTVVFSFISVYSLIYISASLINIESLIMIVSFTTLFSLVVLPLLFFIFFSKEERIFLLEQHIMKIKKFWR